MAKLKEGRNRQEIIDSFCISDIVKKLHRNSLISWLQHHRGCVKCRRPKSRDGIPAQKLESFPKGVGGISTRYFDTFQTLCIPRSRGSVPFTGLPPPAASSSPACAAAAFAARHIATDYDDPWVSLQESFTTIHVDVKDHVAILTINRPEKLNALNSTVMKELVIACLYLDRQHPVCKAIVLTGSGDKAFAAGADIKEMATCSYADVGAFSFPLFFPFLLFRNTKIVAEKKPTHQPMST
jgi:hypothetical protein